MKVQFKNTFATLALSLFLLACNETGTYDKDHDDLRSRDGEVTATLSNREVNFIEDAMEKNATTIFLLQDALQNARDANAKSDAQKMLDEQNALKEALHTYAQNHQISLNDVNLNEREEINSEPGPRWDKEWAGETADIHKAQIRQFENADRFTEEQELKRLIRDNLPRLRSNLQIAQNLESRLD